jgi:hypothetical protein
VTGPGGTAEGTGGGHSQRPLSAETAETAALEHPVGKGVEAVRPIRDEIKGRIEALIVEIDVQQWAQPDREGPHAGSPMNSAGAN